MRNCKLPWMPRLGLFWGPAESGPVEASKNARTLVVGKLASWQVGKLGHGLATLGLGSVSAACVSHSRCPVLVVNTGHDGGTDPGRKENELAERA
ncbi:universal stress protein [Arthrobacter alpinus]|nr:universal stress protein [Arthrobacter alpinus]